MNGDDDKKAAHVETLGGVEIEKSYTFLDPAVPGSYRQVDGRWATANHVMLDAIVRRHQAEEAEAAAQRAADNAAQIMARVGDPNALLWEHRD